MGFTEADDQLFRRGIRYIRRSNGDVYFLIAIVSRDGKIISHLNERDDNVATFGEISDDNIIIIFVTRRGKKRLTKDYVVGLIKNNELVRV